MKPENNYNFTSQTLLCKAILKRLQHDFFPYVARIGNHCEQVRVLNGCAAKRVNSNTGRTKGKSSVPVFSFVNLLTSGKILKSVSNIRQVFEYPETGHPPIEDIIN